MGVTYLRVSEWGVEKIPTWANEKYDESGKSKKKKDLLMNFVCYFDNLEVLLPKHSVDCQNIELDCQNEQFLKIFGRVWRSNLVQNWINEQSTALEKEPKEL